jgi:hypothetical protein
MRRATATNATKSHQAIVTTHARGSIAKVANACVIDRPHTHRRPLLVRRKKHQEASSQKQFLAQPVYETKPLQKRRRRIPMHENVEKGEL